MAEYICADLSERPGCKVSPFWERRERVVRCRDCKHAITSYRDGLPRCAGPLVMEATLVSPDGFCAWGKPREVSG